MWQVLAIQVHSGSIKMVSKSAECTLRIDMHIFSTTEKNTKQEERKILKME